jgi:hypothetical protein
MHTHSHTMTQSFTGHILSQQLTFCLFTQHTHSLHISVCDPAHTHSLYHPSVTHHTLSHHMYLLGQQRLHGPHTVLSATTLAPPIYCYD